MGIIRKAAIGSLIVGLGALALKQNKKAKNAVAKGLTKGKKAVQKSARRVVKTVRSRKTAAAGKR